MGRIPVHIIQGYTTWRGFLLPVNEKHPPLIFNIILNGSWLGNLTYTGQWVADRVPELSSSLGEIVDRWYSRAWVSTGMHEQKG